MKKTILILLLAILPLQYAWAAAAVYCQHEEGLQTSHVGHHTHQHQTQDDGSDDKSKTQKVHSDCGVCQFSAKATFLTASPGGAPPTDAVQSAHLPRFYSSYISDGPLRPNWHLVA